MSYRSRFAWRKSARFVLAALLLAGFAALAACSSSSSDDGGDEVFTVTKKGDAKEVNLGTVPAGSFSVEVKGFDGQKYPYREGMKPTYFMLYDGIYGYDGPTRQSPGILYLSTQYLYPPGYSGKVKGWNHGKRFAEEAYTVAWDPTHWYTVEVTWDGSTISLFLDGQLMDSSVSGPIDSKVIAVMGYPSYFVNPDDTGIIGLQYRNWRFTKR